MSLDELKAGMRALGVTILLVKVLSPNDNRKNQIYLGGGFEALGILPVGSVNADTRNGREILKASVRFFWIQADRPPVEAPNAQLIMYPQYPEVRLSGLLSGSRGAPSSLMASRLPGRILALGITSDGRIIGAAAGPDSLLAEGIAKVRNVEQIGVFLKIPIAEADICPREKLLAELRRVHLKGWIEGQALDSAGNLRGCNSPNCIGYTIEAELGIARNGYSEPDFLGWELKAALAGTLMSIPAGKAITLLTPEPDLGIYQQRGAAEFVRRYGYEDLRGREDRLNFGGIFAAGSRQDRTGLTLGVSGYDASAGRMTSAYGAIELRSDQGMLAAGWSFAKLAKHWNRKHAQAVYVPAHCRTNGTRKYRYGHRVALGEGTDFLRFLAAVVDGQVYYDPALKIEGASGAAPQLKRRSQFRIKAGRLPALYTTMSEVDLLA